MKIIMNTVNNLRFSNKRRVFLSAGQILSSQEVPDFVQFLFHYIMMISFRNNYLMALL
jgi:hypothetical protein